MSTVESRLALRWREAARLLGIDIVAPFSVSLPSSPPINAAVLVKGFGGPNGMLLVTDYAQVRHQRNALQMAGFGFSVLEEPTEEEPFVLEEFIDMLRDWGWSAAEKDEPAWMSSSS